MVLLPSCQKSIDDFFDAIAPHQGAYRHPSFSYLAVKVGGNFEILQAKILLNTGLSKIPASHFASERIRAGHYPLSELGISARALVSSLLSGVVSTPHGHLNFSGNDSNQYAASYDPIHQEGVQAQARFNVLTIHGASHTTHVGLALSQSTHNPLIDWELKASPTPFDSLQDLAFEYSLGSLRDSVNVEMIAFNVAVIDFSESTVSGSRAKVAIRLAAGLTHEKATLGYRLFSQGHVTKRGMLHGRDMQWNNLDDYEHGTVELEIPNAGVLHCFANYAGVTQHFGWVADPATAQNPNRAVYSVFDNGLEILNDFLSKAAEKGRNARDLECAVAWLLWMLGFCVAHLGGTSKTQDAVDLIATTPSGHFAVVECTTGLLKADNKLPLLMERAARVRRGIDASNNKHLRVLPVIVTSRSREEIKADVEQAEKLGVLVVAREDLDQVVVNTLVLPNTEQIYDNAVQAVEAAMQKYNLPGHA